jgi:hypothetical protein
MRESARTLRRILHEGTSPVAIRTVDAAVTRLGLQNGTTADAFVPDHTAIQGHRRGGAMSAAWACHRHGQVGHVDFPIRRRLNSTPPGLARPAAPHLSLVAEAEG